LQNTIANSNANVGGDYLCQGNIVQVVRNVGVIGSGKDPMEIAMGMKTPEEAAAFLRAEDRRRIREIRELGITTVNNVPVLVNDVVVGGPLALSYTQSKSASSMPRSRPTKYDWEKDYSQEYDPTQLGSEGVVVGHQTRLGQVSMVSPHDQEGTSWLFEP